MKNQDRPFALVKTLNQALLKAMDIYSGEECFKIKQNDRYHTISYERVQELTFVMADFLHGRGIVNGKRVAIVAHNCLEWIVVHMACLFTGGVVIPLRVSLAPERLRLILQDSGANLILLQSQEHVQKISAQMSTLPDLEIALMVGDCEDIPQNIIPISNILSEPALLSDTQKRIRKHANHLFPEILAAIHYVTNERGEPRGSTFTQKQCLLGVQQLSEWFHFEEDELAFTCRPWNEVPNLIVTQYYFLSGIPNVVAEHPDKMIENMQQTSPTVMLSIPHNLEMFYEDYMKRLAEEPEDTRRVFQWALAKGKEYRAAQPNASPKLHREYVRANMTFFNRIQGELGGRMRRSYSTGASLTQEVADFFEAVGLQTINVYSLTEAGGFPAATHPKDRRLLSCGQVTSGFQIKVADDGEILVRGETVTNDFWNRPEESEEAFVILDGYRWLYTNDVGYFDDEGYLYVTERKRHLLVMSTGHKIAPNVIENALLKSDFIAQAAIFGEGRPYVSAMIVPDLEKLAAHFEEVKDKNGEAVTTTTHPKVKALLDKTIGDVNSQLDRHEYIKEYSLLDQPLSQDAGELTASMKISRHVVAERYAAKLEEMYPSTVQLEAEDISEVQMDPERLRHLLEKEKILDAWMSDAGIEFLFDLAHEKQIDAPSMVNICDAAATIAQMENEEKPLSTALIVGDPITVARVLPTSQIQLLSHDHIRRMRQTLVTMAKMVDGMVFGYVVDKYGYVRGIHKLSLKWAENKNKVSYLGPHFRQHAEISARCDAVVFFVPVGGRQVRVFADGRLVGRYTDGDWVPDKVTHIEKVVRYLVEERSYDQAVVERILRCAFQMSEENLGAIFMLGRAHLILERSDASEISSFAAITSDEIEHMTDQEIINFAKQDGATLIDMQGRFRGCMVLLRPNAHTEAEIGSGKGSRHSSAAKMSAETDCLAITVSQDGPITMYESGKRILSL